MDEVESNEMNGENHLRSRGVNSIVEAAVASSVDRLDDNQINNNINIDVKSIVSSREN